jgi:hypothetical protein
VRESVEAIDLRILRLHKTWANSYTLLRQIFVLLLLAGIYWLLQRIGVDAARGGRDSAMKARRTLRNEGG